MSLNLVANSQTQTRVDVKWLKLEEIFSCTYPAVISAGTFITGSESIEIL